MIVIIVIVVVPIVRIVVSIPSGRRSARVTAFLFGRTSGVICLELSDYGRVGLSVGNPILYVLNQIRKVQEGILLLTNIYKRGLYARHNAPNFSEKDIPDCAFMFLVFDKQFREFAIFNDGNAGLLPFVNNNFFRHMRLSDQNGASFRCSDR